MKNLNKNIVYTTAKKNLLPGLLVITAIGTLGIAGCSSEDSDEQASHSQHQTMQETDHNQNAMDNMNDTQMKDTVSATVISVDQNQRQVVLDHEAMPTIGMERMTMGFAVADNVNLSNLQSGDRVTITVSMQPGSGLQISNIRKIETAP